MKTDKRIVTWATRVVVILMLSISIGGYAEQPKSSIDLDGNWNEGHRSISPAYPISAYTTSDFLLIQSSILRSDITVTIVKNGAVVYEQNVPVSQTTNIGISISDWEEGTYTLELRNLWGGYFYGNFVR